MAPSLVRVQQFTVIVTSQPAGNWTRFLDPDYLYLAHTFLLLTFNLSQSPP
jgi:hypothetical protein